MTIVEKAAYLKGLVEGLGIESGSRDGKLWGALTDLLSDMAHEMEDLQAADADLADALDEVFVDLTTLEEITTPLEKAEDEDYDEDYDDAEELDNVFELDSYSDDEEDGDEELPYDGVMYDVTCPACGEEITFDESTLEEGSIRCPSCGETLEFDMGDSGE